MVEEKFKNFLFFFFWWKKSYIINIVFDKISTWCGESSTFFENFVRKFFNKIFTNFKNDFYFSRCALQKITTFLLLWRKKIKIKFFKFYFEWKWENLKIFIAMHKFNELSSFLFLNCPQSAHVCVCVCVDMSLIVCVCVYALYSGASVHHTLQEIKWKKKLIKTIFFLL